MASQENIKSDTQPFKRDVPGPLSRSFFCWMLPYFYYGNCRDLEESDLVPATKQYDSKRIGDVLERNWLAEEAAAKTAGKKPSFIKALVKSFGWSFLRGGLMQLTYVSLRTCIPLLFARLLSYWSVKSKMSRETATYYALGMIACNWLAAYFNHHGDLFCEQYGMRIRVATGSLIFRKVMRMSNAALGETTAGKVVNLLSNDLQRFDVGFMYLHFLWIIPLQLAAVCYLGYMQGGYAALIGLAALFVIAIPIQGSLGRLIGKVRSNTTEKTDERVKLMSEVINGIKVIKMYAWEIPFQKVVGEKRADELKEVRKATILRTVFKGFMIFTERAAMFITILFYVLLGNPIAANVIYPLQQFINAAQINITMILPLVMSSTAELLVSIKRVQEFLYLEDRADLMEKRMAEVLSGRNRSNINQNLDINEIKSSVVPLSFKKSDDINRSSILNENSKLFKSVSNNEDFAVVLQDVSASWTADSQCLALKNISFKLRRGKLYAIIGAVGSGKSSVLQLLLNELPTMGGTISVHGQISYAGQEAWLFLTTVRENILFGLPYDPEKYKRVCRVCALDRDFKQFPFGDQSLVGERGVSLSGGQRARINLARAVYREADIYLLDDPLSAVDTNVGRQLFEGCINGYLRGKTRILVTHQVHFLKAADYIIVLNEGRIENVGTFDELATSGKAVARMLNSLQEKEKNEDILSAESIDEKEGKPALLRVQPSIDEVEDERQFEAQKMEEEKRQSGSLYWKLIKVYFRAGGSIVFILFTVGLVVLAAACAAAADYWLCYWFNQMAIYEEGLNGTKIETGLDTEVGMFTTGQYLLIHGAIVLLCVIITNVRVFPFASLCVSASGNLHNYMFSTMIKGIMRFFDTNSSGRILNRFTKDMGALDDVSPRSLIDVLQIYGIICAILILNAIALYWTLILSAILLVMFFFIFKYSIKIAQGLKRLESTAKSPVFGLVSSSLNGIATIRSCGAQDRLIDQFDKHQDIHTSALNSFMTGGETFGFYLDTMCLLYISAVIFVFLYIDFGDAIAVGSVGLAVTQSNTLTAMLQYGARMLIEFLAQLTSVERVLEYTNIETEQNLFEGPEPVPATWPQQGRIVFQNVYLKYAPNEEPVLKNLNIEIKSGWKVGIVGRTGAGKSSLISAVFRFAYIDGVITVDGLDTALVSRQGLRSKISIIPQEPVLFSATIRYNLDPFDIYSDDELWRALEQVDMKSAVPSLDYKVTEGGANFSIGQRQLMCLARAVLRSNKILIMDEATANVDPQTDHFIQQTIRREFAHCTVLTIAHRLNTIMDSDRVLVMSFGEVAEFEHPYILLSDPNSALSSMVRETGDKNSAKLIQIAKDAYFQNNLKENIR